MQTQFEKQFKDYIGAYLKCPWKRRLLNYNRYCLGMEPRWIDITDQFKAYVNGLGIIHNIIYVDTPSFMGIDFKAYACGTIKLEYSCARCDDLSMERIYNEIVRGSKIVYIYKIIYVIDMFGGRMVLRRGHRII